MIKQMHRLTAITLPLPSGSVAILHCPFPMSQEDFGFMLDLLQLMRRAFVLPEDDSEKQRPAAPMAAPPAPQEEPTP